MKDLNRRITEVVQIQKEEKNIFSNLVASKISRPEDGVTLIID